MFDMLLNLGVPVVIQKGLAKYIEVIDGKRIFKYGDSEEVFSEQKHTIPTASNL